MTEEEFDEGFTGVTLFLTPGAEFAPSGQPKSILGFAKKRMRGLGSAVAFVAITMTIASAFGILEPVLSRVYVDRILSGSNPEWAIPFLWGIGIFSVLWVLISWISAIVSLRIDGKLSSYGNTSYMWKVLRMPMEFFSQRMAGDIQQRKLTNETVATTLVNTLAPLLLHTGMLLFYFIVMVRYSWLLTLIGVGAVIINMVLGRIISAKRVNITRVMMRDEGNLYGTTVSGIEMIETIKASGAEDGFFAKWAGYQSNVNVGMERFEMVGQYLGLLSLLVTQLANAAVLVLGIWLVIRGEFTLGCVMAFQGLLEAFSEPAGQLVEAGQTIQEMRTDMERIEDVMEYPMDVNYASEGQAVSEEEGYDKLTGEIELRSVTFGYSPLAEPLLQDFSLKIPAGSRIAIVGASGCGKSTLSKLISGLYQPWSGEILFDGQSRADIDRGVFTGSLAVVDQEIILFEDSISNNIKMWDTSIEDFEVIMAARDAQIHDDIMQRVGGYDYAMLEGGKDFSGGQRQRLEIARVLAQDPTILILDEATSALDAKTEADVVQSIKDRGITCIVVAHRLSTVRDCDEIIVLDHGRIAERGTHEELFALHGYYTSLVTSE